ncbi:MAG TPA: hypothetical protein VL201_05070 [Patescibacteria group bacterium]|jgi:hypothetical protein|nr:hypothetical protein [Patescibacteria group bacterium]
MFLLYPVAKITFLLSGLSGLYGTLIYKKYKNLTVHQQNVVANMPKFTKESSTNPIEYIKQASDLIDTFSKANQIKKSFDTLYPAESLSAQPKKNESTTQYKKRNKEVLIAYDHMIEEKIDPLLEKYTKKHKYPTKTELIHDIFKEK